MTTIADLAETQRLAINALNQRMADFEAHLRASSSGADLSGLHKDFSAFKTHVWNVLSVLQQQMVEVSKTVDVIEMRHRKKFILLNGVPEKADEKVADTVASILQNKFGLSDFMPSSLRVCHRLGTTSDSRPRPILLRFTGSTVKDDIWKTKAKLKGTSLVLSEFLTRQRQTAFSTARKLFGVTNVWTMDGNINVKLPDGKRRRVFCYDEVVALGAEHGKSLEVPSDLKADSKNASPEHVQGQTRSRRKVPKK